MVGPKNPNEVGIIFLVMWPNRVIHISSAV
jgi:hypothetical protein